jgi:hypothetical protein
VNYQYAVSAKIEKAFTEAARSTGGVFGWETILYPAQQAMIVNVPTAEDGVHYQYVMNTLTKAWCKFSAWNAETFAIFNRELYFSRGGEVFKAWVGAADGNDNVIGYGKQAFNNFGVEALKTVTLFRPFLSVTGSLTYSSAVDIDFQDAPIIGTTTASVVGQAQWNVSQWNQARWIGGSRTAKTWSSTA